VAVRHVGSSGAARHRARELDLGPALLSAPDDGPSAAMSRGTPTATYYADAEIQSAPPALLCSYPPARAGRLLRDRSRRAQSRATYGSGRKSSSGASLASGVVRYHAATARSGSTVIHADDWTKRKRDVTRGLAPHGCRWISATPVRNQQVAGSSPAAGSRYFNYF